MELCERLRCWRRGEVWRREELTSNRLLWARSRVVSPGSRRAGYHSNQLIIVPAGPELI